MVCIVGRGNHSPCDVFTYNTQNTIEKSDRFEWSPSVTVCWFKFASSQKLTCPAGVPLCKLLILPAARRDRYWSANTTRRIAYERTFHWMQVGSNDLHLPPSVRAPNTNTLTVNICARRTHTFGIANRCGLSLARGPKIGTTLIVDDGKPSIILFTDTKIRRPSPWTNQCSIQTFHNSEQQKATPANTQQSLWICFLLFGEPLHPQHKSDILLWIQRFAKNLANLYTHSRRLHILRRFCKRGACDVHSIIFFVFPMQMSAREDFRDPTGLSKIWQDTSAKLEFVKSSTSWHVLQSKFRAHCCSSTNKPTCTSEKKVNIS